MGAPASHREEECALDTGQKKELAHMKDARSNLGKEDFVLDMGNHEESTATKVVTTKL
eukprot:CAMPEP_0183738006 /NCGR_PEP_ID=MMETSP0737-20130205/53659_1 /TAXON_ID=385413 /ORGANISM="Thalassiosira miniscula, Strain CCMP1093" /LENGTH=57 /DNA_ID=CAMNT_0025972449 /DNA_START=415 /DNA_END=588 /DNA_ORIENTATION=-